MRALELTPGSAWVETQTNKAINVVLTGCYFSMEQNQHISSKIVKNLSGNSIITVIIKGA